MSYTIQNLEKRERGRAINRKDVVLARGALNMCERDRQKG
jgi:hypothetical protein